ncbi:hypothetical protein AQ490_24985 [Wenjunlia vitaminophila]|uniref:Uncharacterized protein n=1 Tax=Wenjunlia vitaminophila TaxID=76728 RepID=A0A0T6LRQ1_WENVI|nr:hypothetical protein AQ490_24985 [Wenjunlia vitaminophila]
MTLAAQVVEGGANGLLAVVGQFPGEGLDVHRRAFGESVDVGGDGRLPGREVGEVPTLPGELVRR